MDRKEYHPKYLDKTKQAGTADGVEENVYASVMQTAGPKTPERLTGPHFAGPSWQESGEPRHPTTDSEKPSDPEDCDVTYDYLYMRNISADAESQATAESSDEKDNTWKLPLTLTVLAFLVTTVVVLIIAVPSKQPTVSTPLKALQFDITLKDKVFNASLTDPTTIQYKILKVEVEGKLKIILMKTVAGFRSVSVIGFSEGSVVASVNITSNDTEITAESVFTAYKDSNSPEKEFFDAAGLVAVTDKPTTSTPLSTGLANTSPTDEGTVHHTEATEGGKGSTDGQAATVPTTSTMHDITTGGRSEAQCTIEYDQTCYWVVTHSSKDIDFTKAEEICYVRGGILALVPDETLYYLLLNYIRENVHNDVWVYAWTGIRFDVTSWTYTVRNGITSFVRWAIYYPVNNPYSSHVLLRVGAGVDGMTNYLHSFRSHVAICEAELETDESEGSTPVQATTVPTTSTMHDIDTTTRRRNEAQCTVEYDNTCYWVVMHSSKDIDFTKAKAICYARGGILALVPDETLYHLLLDYIRGNVHSITLAYAWTGIRFDVTSGTSTAGNGITSFVRWAIFYPVTNLDYIHVLLRVGGRVDGMTNHPHTFRSHVAICEAELETDESEVSTPGEIGPETDGPESNTSEVCFRRWYIVFDLEYINLGEAEALCLQNGSTLANICSEDHYKQIVDSATKHMTSTEQSVTLWTGMQSYILNGNIVATLRDGSPAPFVKWFENDIFNNDDGSADQIVLTVARRDRGWRDGMIPFPWKYKPNAVICETEE